MSPYRSVGGLSLTPPNSSAPHGTSTTTSCVSSTRVLLTAKMICQRCLRQLAKRNGTSSVKSARNFSRSTALRSQAVSAQETTATNPRPNDKPAATSTSAAQPFSTPLTPSPKSDKLDLPVNTKQSKQPARIASSVPAGTVLKGLNFMKNKQDPVALEDHEYPAWLWTALEKKADATGSPGKDAEGDLFCAY